MEPPSPRSRGERALRPILVVWFTPDVCDTDKGAICEFGNACFHDSEVVVVEVLGRHFCLCCCEWSLGKMKPLVVSLSGELNGREEDAATTWHRLPLFWGTWMNEAKIECCKRNSLSSTSAYISLLEKPAADCIPTKVRLNSFVSETWVSTSKSF